MAYPEYRFWKDDVAVSTRPAAFDGGIRELVSAAYSADERICVLSRSG